MPERRCRMKRLTLDETWKHCLSMWRWIARQIRKYGIKKFDQLNNLDKTDFVDRLKGRWLCRHGFAEYGLQNDCFFCAYAHRHWGYSPICGECPATLIQPSFHCNDDEDVECFKHSYCIHPIGFYNKLVSLNRKRLKQKGSK